MWDLQTALQAVAVVTIASFLLPQLARAVGGICAVIGFFGVMQIQHLGADGRRAGSGGVVGGSLELRAA